MYEGKKDQQWSRSRIGGATVARRGHDDGLSFRGILVYYSRFKMLEFWAFGPWPIIKF
jgi:hypothetical protein